MAAEAMKLTSRARRERRKARRQLWNDIRQCRAHLVTVEEYSRQMGLSTPEADCPDGPGIVSASVRLITPNGDTLYQRICPDTAGHGWRNLSRPRLVFVRAPVDTTP